MLIRQSMAAILCNNLKVNIFKIIRKRFFVMKNSILSPLIIKHIFFFENIFNLILSLIKKLFHSELHNSSQSEEKVENARISIQGNSTAFSHFWMFYTIFPCIKFFDSQNKGCWCDIYRVTHKGSDFRDDCMKFV